MRRRKALIAIEEILCSGEPSEIMSIKVLNKLEELEMLFLADDSKLEKSCVDEVFFKQQLRVFHKTEKDK